MILKFKQKAKPKVKVKISWPKPEMPKLPETKEEAKTMLFGEYRCEGCNGAFSQKYFDKNNGKCLNCQKELKKQSQKWKTKS